MSRIRAGIKVDHFEAGEGVLVPVGTTVWTKTVARVSGSEPTTPRTKLVRRRAGNRRAATATATTE